VTQDPNIPPDTPAGGVAVYWVAACTFCSPTQGTVHYDYWTEDEAAAQDWAVEHVTENPAHHVPITQHVLDYQPGAPPTKEQAKGAPK
jgi:hypothetical protein